MAVSARRTEIYELPADHPGAHDLEYRARRAAIAAVGERFVSGSAIPDVEYTEDEEAVWAVVSAELAAKHERFACAEYRRGSARLQLPRHRVPQLGEVDEHIRSLTGFRIEPVPGLVPTRTFYGALARRTFLSTQYIRHDSVPYYTPEPDIVHEIVGHANMLASPILADLYQAAGAASVRVESDRALDFFSRVFWFTLEFGVVEEDGRPAAYGAGLLSSFGEIEVFRQADLRPWDVGTMGRQDYDITRYQPVLYVAPSFDRMVADLTSFFERFDDDTPDRIATKGAA